MTHIGRRDNTKSGAVKGVKSQVFQYEDGIWGIHIFTGSRSHKIYKNEVVAGTEKVKDLIFGFGLFHIRGYNLTTMLSKVEAG